MESAAICTGDNGADLVLCAGHHVFCTLILTDQHKVRGVTKDFVHGLCILYKSITDVQGWLYFVHVTKNKKLK